MTATRRLVLDLPEHTAERIAADVASGRFASPAEVVAAAVEQLEDDQALPSGVTPAAWAAFGARTRAVAARLDAGVEPTFTSDEVKAYLAERRRVRASAKS